jgi:hypothetical protein
MFDAFVVSVVAEAANPETALLEIAIAVEPAAVIKPLPLTVNVPTCEASPNEPVFELTVASVIVDPEVVASPDRFAAAVTSPLPFTVTLANVPTFEFTVARVKTVEPADDVASPLNAGICEDVTPVEDVISVPEVGNVTFVAPESVNVSPKLPETVIVLALLLLTPVPPWIGSIGCCAIGYIP